ncbi:threonine/homoserine/homoserine lactone efflux protein [Anaerospora hongkongensis]|uniref:Threonine/homoserine/homoserine lactone efflux protein n=1 Tax=Anaerospora hongkongensis TaxID=244830 RepID=A0A4R1PTH8_9FIRM|nr:LysE family translocator [Anaerospora hongkongensis]TCL35095.1 threonine/homoserine/homoserine lactone efflux protein [Anaerospora hongkongensis]
MFGIIHYEMFLAASIILNMTPGSDTIYVLSRSIAQGRRTGIYSVLGTSAGCVVHTVLAALGLSVILAQSAVVFMMVKIAGAVYLGYLGLTMLLAKDTLATAPSQAAMSPKDTFWQGLIIDVLNPKVALFFLSFLPQFIDPQNSYGIIPFLILGLTFIVTGALWLLFVVYFSAKVTTLLREKTNVMNKVCGSIYILLGAKLLAAEKS